MRKLLTLFALLALALPLLALAQTAEPTELPVVPVPTEPVVPIEDPNPTLDPTEDPAATEDPVATADPADDTSDDATATVVPVPLPLPLPVDSAAYVRVAHLAVGADPVLVTIPGGTSVDDLLAASMVDMDMDMDMDDDMTGDATAEATTAMAEATAEATDDAMADMDMPDDGTLAFGDFGPWTAVPAGAVIINVGDDFAPSVTLAAGTFTTLLVVDGEMGMALVPVQEVLGDDYLPGTATISFVNATTAEQSVNFLRDDVVYVTSLLPSPTDVDNAGVSVREDVGTFVFSSTSTGEDSPLSALDELQTRERDGYLFVAVDDEDGNPSIIVDVTPAYEIDLVTGAIPAPGDLAAVIGARELTAALLPLIVDAGLDEALAGDGPFTVFVPANYVLDGADLSGVDLDEVLLTHVVEGDVRLFDLVNAESAIALNGTTLTITVEGDAVFVNGARLLDVNLSARNGTLHIIDNILLPDGGLAR